MARRLVPASLVHWPQRGLMALVQGYRLLLKPWIGNACRFEPTCSAYALQALQGHGALGGSLLTARRLLRCHPWCDGGCDPVPEARRGHGADHVSGLFTGLLPSAAEPAPEPDSSSRTAAMAPRKHP